MDYEVHETASPDYLVLDQNGYRYLLGRNGQDAMHGMMELNNPERLPAEYALAMMRAVLFKPSPADVLIVGLGPGMQVKFIHRRMPHTRVVVVEIDPEMVGIARRYFAVPADDERLAVVIDDGARHVAQQNERYDLIFSDCFGTDFAMLESLSNASYYRSCMRALRDGGMLGINVFRKDGEWQERHLALLRSLFPAVLVLGISHEQTVLIAFKSMPLLDLDVLAERARRLEPELNIGLPDFVELLRIILTPG